MISFVSRHKELAYEEEVIRALCNICHFLMSESRLPIHKTRSVVWDKNKKL